MLSLGIDGLIQVIPYENDRGGRLAILQSEILLCCESYASSGSGWRTAPVAVRNLRQIPAQPQKQPPRQISPQRRLDQEPRARTLPAELIFVNL